MFTEQQGLLLNAGFTAEQVAALGQCEQQLRHNGPVMFDYQWPENATDNWGATRYRTNPKGIAGNVLAGRWIFQPNSSVEFNTTNVTFNGGGANSMRFINKSGEKVPAGGVMKITNDSVDATG